MLADHKQIKNNLEEPKYKCHLGTTSNETTGVVFTHDSEAECLCCGVSPGSELCTSALGLNLLKKTLLK